MHRQKDGRAEDGRTKQTLLHRTLKTTVAPILSMCQTSTTVIPTGADFRFLDFLLSIFLQTLCAFLA